MTNIPADALLATAKVSAATFPPPLWERDREEGATKTGLVATPSPPLPQSTSGVPDFDHLIRAKPGKPGFAWGREQTEFAAPAVSFSSQREA